MKKFLVLFILFALPILAYLFFASGKNNFARLPVLVEGTKDVEGLASLDGRKLSFKNKISVVAFFGSELEEIRGLTFNLDQKILEKYYEFDDFQFIIVLPEGAREESKQFAGEFSGIGNPHHWNFAFGTPDQVREVFESLESGRKLDEHLHTPFVFILDKEGRLRGRDDDQDQGLMYGYDAGSVAELANKMNDDVKVILAEYRLALKKNQAERKP